MTHSHLLLIMDSFMFKLTKIKQNYIKFFILSEAELACKSEADGHTYCDEHNLLGFCV